jgi:hypothetical protein
LRHESERSEAQWIIVDEPEIKGVGTNENGPSTDFTATSNCARTLASSISWNTFEREIERGAQGLE